MTRPAWLHCAAQPSGREDNDGLECIHLVVAGCRRAGGRRVGHRHLLPADAGAGLPQPARWPRTLAAPLTARSQLPWRRGGAVPGTAAAAAGPARRAGARATATSTSTSASTVQVRRLGCRRQRPRAPTAAAPGRPAWRPGRPATGRACHRAVQGNQLLLERRPALTHHKERSPWKSSSSSCCHRLIFIARHLQDRAAAARLGGGTPGQVPPHAHARG
jgi:hypothetical protein